MKTYKMKVWHDYQVTDTYEVEMQASSEEEAMQLSGRSRPKRRGRTMGRGRPNGTRL